MYHLQENDEVMHSNMSLNLYQDNDSWHIT